MAHICLVSPHHAANNPRLVRDASALAEAGHEVTAVMLRFDLRWARLEGAVMSQAKWRLVNVDFLAGQRWRWVQARLRRRICDALSRRLLLPGLAWRATLYGFPELLRAARGVPADLYIAHAHPALPVAALAAERRGCQVAFDAEDLLAEAPSEPVTLHELCERRFIRQCAFVATMSEVAAQYLREKHSLRELPLVLHNVFPRSAREGVVPPKQRSPRSRVAVYWFGQTIGRNSCADQLLRAMPLVSEKYDVVVRGNALPAYAEELRALAAKVNASERLHVLPVVEPEELVRAAGHYDILFGAQPGSELYTRNAIGNKVMAGALAGLALLLTDTPAHRCLLQQWPGIGALYRDGDTAELASILEHWARDRDELKRVQQRAWDAGWSRLNWDVEAQLLTSRVAELLSARSASQVRTL